MFFSSVAWILHDLGVATSVGGNVFGQSPLRHALREIKDPEERHRVEERAWHRFTVLSGVSHGAAAATWLAGRAMLSGQEVSGRARTLTCAKDALVAASVVTFTASTILGLTLGKRRRERLASGQSAELAPDSRSGWSPSTSSGASNTSGAARPANPPSAADGHPTDDAETSMLSRAERVVGTLNTVANIGVLATTTMLAAESAKSHRFSFLSRRLP